MYVAIKKNVEILPISTLPNMTPTPYATSECWKPPHPVCASQVILGGPDVLIYLMGFRLFPLETSHSWVRKPGGIVGGSPLCSSPLMDIRPLSSLVGSEWGYATCSCIDWSPVFSSPLMDIWHFPWDHPLLRMGILGSIWKPWLFIPKEVLSYMYLCT